MSYLPYYSKSTIKDILGVHHTLMLGSPGTLRQLLPKLAWGWTRNAESNKNETKKIGKQIIKGIIAFFTARRMMVVPCKLHREKVSNRQSNCRCAPWYRLYMWRVLVLKVGPWASFLEDLVGLWEISTVYFPPKNVVDTQYVLGTIPTLNPAEVRRKSGGSPGEVVVRAIFQIGYQQLSIRWT